MGDLVEIRWHGRGGQGVVTASQVLAEAALQEDRHFQAFPEFGPERTGAPVRAFTRLSSSPIPLHCPVAHPDIAVVLDPTLLSVANLFEGLKEKGTVVINTPLAPRAVKERLPGRGRCKVVTVDATGIAMEAFNRNMPNMPILGALLRASPLVSKESCLRALQERLGARLETAVVEANAKAFERGYAEARID
ncbi:MAG: 2-oxoacid:acceptor oxidoreductase family protein [Chloroflexi bacterium]|nr:2-oxoacid:acceptor oxidoreductase family protein [Chloroflexota bacterium]